MTTQVFMFSVHCYLIARGDRWARRPARGRVKAHEQRFRGEQMLVSAARRVRPRPTAVEAPQSRPHRPDGNEIKLYKVLKTTKHW